MDLCFDCDVLVEYVNCVGVVDDVVVQGVVCLEVGEYYMVFWVLEVVFEVMDDMVVGVYVVVGDDDCVVFDLVDCY